jgi:hypothetical protein
MRQKGSVLLPVIIIIALIGIVGYLIYQNTQLRNGGANPSPTITNTATNLPEPTSSSKPTTNWKKETRQVNYKSEGMENRNYNLEFNYPSDWSIQKISSTHENDKLITNCVNYTLTNPTTNASVVIEPICTDWQETDYPHPSNSEIIQKMDKQGNLGSTKYWLRYFSSEGNMYAYYEASVAPGESLTNNTKVSDVVLISYPLDDWFFIPVKFWLSAPAGTKINNVDVSTSDLIIKSLKLIRIN